ncbi:hypothetical protein BJ684DRAFT_8940 [Piptocephalis cylindrospora]|uniref:chitin deacetylase n=1 Tax=Piptocephalis cylindrospora TaxID=1907219 RepID=A0A4P9Y5I3_9FUNG|nr:hypothetical protein BJ684DRAFT_8940 [Piptocephalis cylindrospora]|eukprot:RKP14213.1 hypothetical protein BJ684DRAFT_8940 [Piptocephalis cylindrospora]
MDPSQLSGLDLSKVPSHAIRPKGVPCVGNKADGCWWSCDQCKAPTDVSRCPGPKQWGLTFDDGPSGNTTALLDFLDQRNIKATLFIVGSRVTDNPDILRRAYKAKHQIAIHTWSHTALTSQSNEQIIAEMSWTQKIIKSAIGVTPLYMRPPYGDIDDRVRGVLAAMGLKVILWDRDTNDWRLNFGNPTNYNPAWISGNETKWIDATVRGEDNPITLEHDLTVEGIREAMTVIPRITDAGISVLPVGECLKDSRWYAEDDGSELRTSSAGAISSAISSTCRSERGWYATVGLMAVYTIVMFVL